MTVQRLILRLLRPLAGVNIKKNPAQPNNEEDVNRLKLLGSDGFGYNKAGIS
jgi:hypothetical protein